MLINWDNLPKIAGMRAGSDRRGICGDKMSVVRVETTPDAAFDGKTHWHDNEQMLIMVSGMVRLVIDGGEFEAHPGDLVFFPAGSRHAAIGTGPEGCVYYEMFAPARPDQLPGWVGSSVLRFD
ncbi:cupin domain-containing protein [Actibacterium sp. MT2.3-13A]|uniref:cupin domain-containing protein n=1 Tax=Actibacterium sp. MT2.3-13A TaxID=2828332 RepID=UPI001BA5A6EF|nr:cupin domain-containing protein [Actibacterium sp. MT2.3-13A]